MQAPTLIGAEKGLTLPICTSSQPATYENSVEWHEPLRRAQNHELGNALHDA